MHWLTQTYTCVPGSVLITGRSLKLANGGLRYVYDARGRSVSVLCHGLSYMYVLKYCCNVDHAPKLSLFA